MENNYKELYRLIEEKREEKNEIILSIIIPMYNEENTISSLLEKLPKHESIEIIVIDDSSTDNGVKQVKQVKSQKNIRLIKHEKNKGYGASIITGIKNAVGKIIVTLDADGQHDPHDILVLTMPIFEGKFDCTIGSRYLGKYHYELPIRTRLGEATLEKIIKIFFGVRVINNQSGFRCFDRDILYIFDDIMYKGFAFATEIILKTSINQYKIQECPITLIDREYGQSKIVLKNLIMDIFSCLLRYYFKKLKLILFKKRRMRIIF